MPPDTNVLLHAAPGLILLFIAETIFLIKERRFQNHKKDFSASLWLGAGFIVSSFISKGVMIFVYGYIYKHRFFNLYTGNWYVWLLCFFADDFTYYWFHRISHKVRVFWASHIVHHSSEVFSFAVAFREGWTGGITGVFLFWAWLPLLGFDPGIIIFLKSVSVIYQFSLHTETIKKLPKWFEYIFNTPSHHRVHHGSDLVYLDKNYAGILIIWDKVFNTFEAENYLPRYGLTKKIPSTNAIVIAFYEWNNLFEDLKRSKSIKDFSNYLFNAPGWHKKNTTLL
jgi:sterol desaturase/sphingolipid hydroxylase (fatty acid hydroxylase superfamily)